MSASIDKLVDAIEQIAPLELASDWDNSGLLLRCSDSVSRVMIALDATEAVADEAVRMGCDFLFVHHPLIFSPLKALSFLHSTQSVVMKLIRAGISLYAAHTSFDCAPGGINDALAAKLGLADVETAADGAGAGLMRIGWLPRALDADAFSAHVKAALGLSAVRVSQPQAGPVSTVAVVGGSGGELASEAKRLGAQALVTGEARHHHHIEAAAQGVLLVEAGHFETEYLFVDTAFKSLQALLNAVQLDVSLCRAQCERAPSASR